MNIQLPPGFTASYLKPEYDEGAIETINAAYCWMNGGNYTTAAEMLAEWNSESFNRETDSQVVLDPDGRVVGYIDLWDLITLHVRWYSLGFVHPDYTGRGIGAYLLEWSIENGRKKVHKAPEGARVVLQQGANATNQAAHALFTHYGFQPVRQSYRMRIDFTQPPQPPQIPDGIEIRPFRPEEERALQYATYESFRDHWGASDEPFEDYARRWKSQYENDPNFDPTLWFIAKEGDEVAGVALCYGSIEEVAGMGWVGTLGVRRPWRKRGLGLALLQYSFDALHRLGCTSAGLGVDTSNLTGALRLYEKAGMRPWRTNTTYEYELRPGKNLLKQKLEN